MNQIAMERVNEQVATRSASNDHMNVVKAQPLERRDELGLDQGHLGANLDPRSVRFELREERMVERLVRAIESMLMAQRRLARAREAVSMAQGWCC